MIVVKSMSEEEMNSIAEAFADYNYYQGEKGLIYLFKSREIVIEYLKTIIKASLKAQMIYTNSNQREGFIIISDTTKPMPLSAMLTMFKGMIKALGLKGFINFSKHCQSGGGSIEMKMRKKKENFIQIEMLAIKKQYQGQGHMRSLMNIAYKMADQKGLPCILVTDDQIKKDKYVHLGMELINIRQVDENAYLYDFIRNKAN